MANDKITAAHLLVPFALLAFVVALFLSFQSTLLRNDHNELVKARAEQEKTLEQVTKLKAQATALALGTLKLSQQGDKNATDIIELMKKSGIKVEDKPPSDTANPAPAAPAPTPAP